MALLAIITELWTDGWIGSLLRGALVTVLVSLSSIVLGLVLGTIGGLAKWGSLFPLTLLVDGYTSLVRSVPELLIIFLLFFGSVELVSNAAAFLGFLNGIDTAYAFIVGVGAIGFISGAYLVEVVRGALAAIPKGHIEAAQAVGLPRPRIFFRIILPQAARLAVPGINNVWQSTIKDTALISVVGLQELMRIASIGANATRQPFVFFFSAAAIYLGVTVLSQSLFNAVERAVRLKGRRA